MEENESRANKNKLDECNDMTTFLPLNISINIIQPATEIFFNFQRKMKYDDVHIKCFPFMLSNFSNIQLFPSIHSAILFILEKQPTSYTTQKRHSFFFHIFFLLFLQFNHIQF